MVTESAIVTTTSTTNIDIVRRVVDTIWSRTIDKCPVLFLIPRPLVSFLGPISERLDLAENTVTSNMIERIRRELPNLSLERRELLVRSVFLLAIVRDLGIADRLFVRSLLIGEEPPFQVAEFDVSEDSVAVFALGTVGIVDKKSDPDNAITIVEIDPINFIFCLLTAVRTNVIERHASSRLVSIHIRTLHEREEGESLRVKTLRILDLPNIIFSKFILEAAVACTINERLKPAFGGLNRVDIASFIDYIISLVRDIPIDLVSGRYLATQEEPYIRDRLFLRASN